MKSFELAIAFKYKSVYILLISKQQASEIKMSSLEIIALLSKKTVEFKSELNKACKNNNFRKDLWSIGQAKGHKDIYQTIEFIATNKAYRWLEEQ